MILNRFKNKINKQIGHEFEEKKIDRETIQDFFDDENIRDWIYPETPTVNV